MLGTLLLRVHHTYVETDTSPLYSDVHPRTCLSAATVTTTFAMTSSSSSSDEGEMTLADLQQKHKKELRKFQLRERDMTKKAKKSERKSVKDQLEKEKKELEEKHQKEIAEFEAKSSGEKEVEKEEESTEPTEEETRAQEQAEKLQRKREKLQRKKQRQQEAEDEKRKEAEAAASKMVNHKQIEWEALLENLEKMGLDVKQVQSDGHCLYRSIALQTEEYPDFQSIRELCAKELRAHPEKYMPFLVNEETGDLYTEEEYEAHIHRVSSTADWGGHIELTALSNALQRPLWVFQADVEMQRVGEEYTGKSPIRLSYHRHAFGLGEHYNAVVGE